MPIDEVITTLEQAVLAAAARTKEAADDRQSPLAPQTATAWAEVTHTLSQSLSLVRAAYNSSR